ncbi:hypothetical protein FGO68_gene12387 [Halteria grandinella]|uniref:Uncharacterized protein n=1 Tax=Halteria grandinella TaxID=5974 RepID=A0A8J8N9P7_HALGN|nr:hypothetical protein FGO68_gene12387 [Halteria grandinella]
MVESAVPISPHESTLPSQGLEMAVASWGEDTRRAPSLSSRVKNLLKDSQKARSACFISSKLIPQALPKERQTRGRRYLGSFREQRKPVKREMFLEKAILCLSDWCFLMILQNEYEQYPAITRQIMRGLDHHSLFLPFLGKSRRAGNEMVIGSRVRGRLKPSDFRMLFLRERRVRRQRNATEH